MLISLSGTKRSGKDTIADVLVKEFKYTKVAFADSLRELCTKVFDLSENMFIDDDKKEARFITPIRLDEEHLGLMLSIIENDWKIPVSKESKDKMLLKVGKEMTYPRQILQYVGTEVVRDCIDPDFWIKALERRIDGLADVVIADARLKNERDWAKSRGALLCIVQRPNFIKQDSHRSENELEDNYQIVFNNDDTLTRFQIEVGAFFNSYFKRTGYK
jgi:hypothetical protein